MKGQVTGDSFTQVLKDVGNVTKNAGQQSKNLTDAYKTINDFVANIKGASLHDTYYLQRRLIKALRVANYPFECYYSKASYYSYYSSVLADKGVRCCQLSI